MTARVFNPIETLLLVWAAGCVLTRTGDTLHIETERGKGSIPPELIDHIKVNKHALLAVMPEQPRPPSPHQAATSGVHFSRTGAARSNNKE